VCIWRCGRPHRLSERRHCTIFPINQSRRLCQSAIERQLEIACDALSQLRKHDAALFAKIPEGDLLVAFRNALAHGYATLDHRRVYDIASARAAELQSVLEKLLSEIPEEGAE
jgi:uncharacterized protein YutE (UPF0331/DUF86 family)